MQVTPQQASEALEDIDKAGRKVCYAASNRVGGHILLIWGTIWIACYSISHFAHHLANWAWLVGNAVGIPATIWLGWIATRRGPVLSESDKRLGKRIGWFWFAMFIYADVWLVVLHPWEVYQLSVFICTLVMFAYVVMGLWLQDRFWIYLGLLVTVQAFGGYLGSMLIPGYLGLYLAIVCGGTLLAAGAYLTIKCAR
jgi:hypothetical protein